MLSYEPTQASRGDFETPLFLGRRISSRDFDENCWRKIRDGAFHRDVEMEGAASSGFTGRGPQAILLSAALEVVFSTPAGRSRGVVGRFSIGV